MAGRIDLRAYQQSLNDRIAGGANKSEQISTLGIVLAGKNWLVEMADVSEVLEVPRVSAIPLCQSWVIGMANIRGLLYCVADLAAFRKLGRASGNASNRIILVADEFGFNAALLVDAVLGLRDASLWPMRDGAWVDASNTAWQKLNIADLLADEQFLHLGASLTAKI
jgi:twitching motility protein PilI